LCGLSSDQEVTDDFWLGDGGVVVQEIEGSQWLLKSWKSNISSDFIKELRDVIKSMQSGSFEAVLHLSLFHIFSHIDISEGGFGSTL